MVWAGVAAAGIAAASQLLQSGANHYFSKEAFRESKAWEKEKLQNAHQWTVEDMRKAGLNPILAAGNANSAGATSQMQPAQAKLSASEMIMLGKQFELMDAQIDKEKSLTRQADATAHNQWVQSDLNSANTSLQQAMLPQVQSAARLAQIQNEFDIDNPWTWQVSKFANSAGSVGSAFGEFIPVAKMVKNFFANYGSRR